MTFALACPSVGTNSTLDPFMRLQIFFLAGVGQPAADLLKSPFVEKLDARGYEVLLLNEPLDEIVLSHLRSHKSLDFQDVSKKGFRFGDEGACRDAQFKRLD